MRRTVHLRFTMEVDSEESAWDVCEALEKAALRQNYTGISAWLEGADSRSGILVRDGEQPLTTEAMTVERNRGEEPTGIGDAEGVLVPAQWGAVQD